MKFLKQHRKVFININLKADTRYTVGVVNYGSTGQRNPVSQTSDIHTSTRKLKNLQLYTIYDRTDSLMSDWEEVPENTADTIYFRAKFSANPDFLARFDVNNDGVVDNNDVIALQEVVDGKRTIPDLIARTQYNYVGFSMVNMEILRGDINGDSAMWNKDGDSVITRPDLITQDDVDRLTEFVIHGNNEGSVKFKLLLQSVYEEYKHDFSNGTKNVDDYTVAITTINTIPNVNTETIIDGTFTGLKANQEYVVLAYSQNQKYYATPHDMWSLVTHTFS